MTRIFTFDENGDRNRIAAVMGEAASPRGTTWAAYIKHRLRMMENGIETYTTRQYARLRLDKFIEWHRAIDRIAGRLVNHKPAIIYVGAGQIAANSIISIRKHVRCPGTRKLVEAFNKRGTCLIRMVDEYMTSQHCAKCFNHFPRRTKSYRFKTCHNCQPNPIVDLPTLIVTNVSKRVLQMKRTIMKEWKLMAEMLNEIAAIITSSNTNNRLVSKKHRIFKTWQPNANVNAEDVADQPLQKTVWHRDIAAAKLILYKGMLFWWKSKANLKFMFL